MPQRPRYVATAEQIERISAMTDAEARDKSDELLRTHLAVTAFYRNSNLIDQLPEEDRSLNTARIAGRLGVQIVQELPSDVEYTVGPYCPSETVRGAAVWEPQPETGVE